MREVLTGKVKGKCRVRICYGRKDEDIRRQLRMKGRNRIGK